MTRNNRYSTLSRELHIQKCGMVLGWPNGYRKIRSHNRELFIIKTYRNIIRVYFRYADPLRSNNPERNSNTGE